jgi:hypothetical protein
MQPFSGPSVTLAFPANATILRDFFTLSKRINAALTFSPVLWRPYPVAPAARRRYIRCRAGVV